MGSTQKKLLSYWKEQRRQWHWANRVQFKGKVFGVTTYQELPEARRDNRTIAQTMRDQKRKEKKDVAQVQR